MIRGRFAPSPTGDLHLGNLRTAVAAHASATNGGGEFVIRMEDLDRVTSSSSWAMRQLVDLAAVGVNSDTSVVHQSRRFAIYMAYERELADRELTYPCFCSRKDVAEAAVAPHGRVPLYGGRCRNLSSVERSQLAEHRRPSTRLKVKDEERANGLVNDIVLVRNDGVPSYNLAVVVDDELQGITQVVRGEDLADVTPSQEYLQKLLGFRKLEYVHLPLMVGPDGERLAKRHGDVTLADCLKAGFSATAVRRALLRSLDQGTNGWGPASSLAEWLKSLT